MTRRINKTKKSAGSLELQRKQLDARFTKLPPLESPRTGWIRTFRQSLGMTMKQLGKRLNTSPQSVLDMEAREKSETISIAKLRQAADALNCELQIVFVPRTSLQETVRQQATIRAREERNRLVHTMRLEAQSEGVDEALDEKKAVERWLTERTGRLWD